MDIDYNLCSFFTMDTKSMYTNIDRDHALLVFERFFKTSPLCASSPGKAIVSALKIIMLHNYFKFGDTF